MIAPKPPVSMSLPLPPDSRSLPEPPRYRHCTAAVEHVVAGLTGNFIGAPSANRTFPRGAVQMIVPGTAARHHGEEVFEMAVV